MTLIRFISRTETPWDGLFPVLFRATAGDAMSDMLTAPAGRMCTGR